MRARLHRLAEPPRLWIGAFVLGDLLLVPVAAPEAIVALCALLLLFRILWWQTLLLAVGILAAAPLAAAVGTGSSLDDYAVVALALLGTAIGTLGLAERRRTKSASAR